MSLKDTIEGARREAESNVIGRPKKEAAAVTDEEKKGFSRPSAAKAKPVREAASSVRTASKPKSADPWVSETKDEKRERKRREREAQDARNRAYDLVRRRPYRKKAEVMVHSMSDKRMLELFEQDRAAQLEKRRQKEERRKK